MRKLDGVTTLFPTQHLTVLVGAPGGQICVLNSLAANALAEQSERNNTDPQEEDAEYHRGGWGRDYGYRRYGRRRRYDHHHGAYGWPWASV